MKNILIITFIFCLSFSQILAQDKLNIDLKGRTKPDIYIDGKKYDYAIFELLDQRKIESITVIKDEQAIKEYGAPNGVIVIKTKRAATVSVDEKEIKIRNSGTDKDPVIFIDGKESNKENLSKLSPDDIKSIEVVKGEKAIDEYNAPNGVVIVKTKN